MVGLLQLRHLVLDHLDPRRLLHDVRRRLEQRWSRSAIAIGWPLVSAFILIIGFCMSELVSAYPTSGGIYWWASKLGGARAGFYTGWLNLVGLLAIEASVAYGCATFFDLTLDVYSKSWADNYSLTGSS